MRHLGNLRDIYNLLRMCSSRTDCTLIMIKKFKKRKEKKKQTPQYTQVPLSSHPSASSPLSRWQEEQPPPGLRHRHGEPGDGEGGRGHPVAVQEIPEKEAGWEALERPPSAAPSPDVGPAFACQSNCTVMNWEGGEGVGFLKAGVPGVGWPGAKWYLCESVCVITNV